MVRLVLQTDGSLLGTVKRGWKRTGGGGGDADEGVDRGRSLLPFPILETPEVLFGNRTGKITMTSR